ncbi:MAG: F0F1 ATP synthase subunit delta [bacterium]
MLKRAIGSRYAKALFELAKETNSLESAEKDFPQVVRVLETEPDFRSFMNHPAIVPSEKKSLLEKLFKGKIGDEIYDFLSLLVDKNREEYIPIINEELQGMLMEHQGRQIMKVYTPFEMTAETKAMLIEGLAKSTGKKVEIEEVVDPALIGGVKVQIGDKVFDGSVKSGLEKLREALMTSKV